MSFGEPLIEVGDLRLDCQAAAVRHRIPAVREEWGKNLFEISWLQRDTWKIGSGQELQFDRLT